MAQSRRKRVKNSDRTRYFSYLVTAALIAIILAMQFMYSDYAVSQTSYSVVSSIALSLLFASVVFSYLLSKGKGVRDILHELGLSRAGLSARNVAIGIALLIATLVFGAALQEFSAITGLPLPTNVQTLLAGMPLYFLAFTFLVAPLCEEIMFRGFLVPRIGIVLSAVVFAIPHLLTYGSVSEFAAALFFGLLAGYVLKRTRSLYPSIIAHMLVNLLTVVAIAFILVR